MAIGAALAAEYDNFRKRAKRDLDDARARSKEDVIRELLPVGQQKVRARLPASLRAKAVRLLVANASPAFRQDGDWLEVTVPSILAHEVVAIEV